MIKSVRGTRDLLPPARRRGAQTGADDIRRPAQQLFYTALPGTTPDHPEWIRRKTNVLFRFHRASYAIGLEMAQKQSTMYERYGLPIADYACHGGSFPLRVRGAGFILMSARLSDVHAVDHPCPQAKDYLFQSRSNASRDPSRRSASRFAYPGPCLVSPGLAATPLASPSGMVNGLLRSPYRFPNKATVPTADSAFYGFRPRSYTARCA